MPVSFVNNEKRDCVDISGGVGGGGENVGMVVKVKVYEELVIIFEVVVVWL